MATAGQMIGAIAHQWKQPVNTISLIVQNLQDAQRYGDLDETTIASQTHAIMEQVEYMSHTIQDFRDFLKPSRQLLPFMACESAEEIRRLLEPQLKKHNITLAVHPHEHFEAIGFPNEFKQALMNIILNPRDALEEKGMRNGKIDIFISHDATSGTICVQDNGGGIDESLLPEKLFETEVSTKIGKGGSGLGLQICKNIIEGNMSGTLRARNIEGGAEFVITLPLHQQRDAKATA